MNKFDWVGKILTAANFIVEIEKQSVADEILASIYSKDLCFIANQLAIMLVNTSQKELNADIDIETVARMTGCAENEAAT